MSLGETNLRLLHSFVNIEGIKRIIKVHEDELLQVIAKHKSLIDDKDQLKFENDRFNDIIQLLNNTSTNTSTSNVLLLK